MYGAIAFGSDQCKADCTTDSTDLCVSCLDFAKGLCRIEDPMLQRVLITETKGELQAKTLPILLTTIPNHPHQVSYRADQQFAS